MFNNKRVWNTAISETNIPPTVNLSLRQRRAWVGLARWIAKFGVAAAFRGNQPAGGTRGCCPRALLVKSRLATAQASADLFDQLLNVVGLLQSGERKYERVVLLDLQLKLLRQLDQVPRVSQILFVIRLENFVAQGFAVGKFGIPLSADLGWIERWIAILTTLGYTGALCERARACAQDRYQRRAAVWKLHADEPVLMIPIAKPWPTIWVYAGGLPKAYETPVLSDNG